MKQKKNKKSIKLKVRMSVLAMLLAAFIITLPEKVDTTSALKPKMIQATVNNMLLEHVIIHVDDLTQSIKDYESLGFTVTYGGQHGGGFSHNALIHFKDGSFIELVAFQHTPVLKTLLHLGVLDLYLKDTIKHVRYRFAETVTYPEGFIDSALLSNEINIHTSNANRLGLITTQAMPMTRKKPSGELIKWKIMSPLLDGLPFVRSPYIPAQIINRQQTQHKNGVTGVASIHYGVRDLVRAKNQYEQLLGGISFDMDSDKTRASYQLDQVRITLVKVSETSTPYALAKNIRDVPVEISLFTDMPSKVGALNINTSHGAKINIVAH